MMGGPGRDAGAAQRILLVMDSLAVGGAERHVADLARSLSEHGHDVTVAGSAGGLLAGELARPIRVHILGRRTVKRRFSITYAWWLRRIVRQGNFTLVHSHAFASSMAAAVATLGTSTPLLITEHSEGTWKGPGARWMSRWMYRRAGGVIAVSAVIGDMLVERYRVPPNRVSTVVSAIRPSCPRHTLVPRPAGWAGRPLVGVVARLQPDKGIDTFLDAVTQVAAARPEVRYVVIGDGPLRGSLMRQAVRLGLERRVHFTGFLPDARAMLPALDILAVPSRSEGSPLVILEAMAAGVPIVATAVGGIPEQVRDGQEALLTQSHDAAGLARAMLDLLDHPERAHRLAVAARHRAAGCFSYDRMLRDVTAVYRSLHASRLHVAAEPAESRRVANS